jgi:hypothetical protein
MRKSWKNLAGEAIRLGDCRSRRLDRETAMRILVALARFQSTGEGDVKLLTDREGLYRLRVGKWRVFFDLDAPDEIRAMVSTTAVRLIEVVQQTGTSLSVLIIWNLSQRAFVC